ncbi:MAG: porin family protein, partial [Holophagales bacterium]|nr:porin family protein [Holophagales bacterium]
DERIDDARWSFGALRVQPWIGVRDVSYVTDQSVGDAVDAEQADENDLTVTAGAGIRAYLRKSPKMLLAAHVLPEYVWWQDNDDKSVLNGRYGAGFFGFWNRLRLEVSFRREEQQGFFSPELQVLTSVATDTARAAVEVDVARGITVYATAGTEDFAGSSDDAEVFTLLDRSSDRIAAGVRFESAQGYWASVEYEDATTDFEPAARDLSNEGTAVTFGLGFDRGQLKGEANVALREVEPAAGSLFRPFDDTTGRVQLRWSPRKRWDFLLFGSQSQGYSIDLSQSTVLSRRVGASITLRPGSSAFVVSAATGEDELTSVLESLPDRVDDVEELQARFLTPIGDLLRLELRATSLQYDSPIPELDREITRYGVSLELGRILERLRLGDDSGIW